MLLAHMTRDQLCQEFKSLQDQLEEARHCHRVQLENAQALQLENEHLEKICKIKALEIVEKDRRIAELEEDDREWMKIVREKDEGLDVLMDQRDELRIELEDAKQSADIWYERLQDAQEEAASLRLDTITGLYRPELDMSYD